MAVFAVVRWIVLRVRMANDKKNEKRSKKAKDEFELKKNTLAEQMRLFDKHELGHDDICSKPFVLFAGEWKCGEWNTHEVPVMCQGRGRPAGAGTSRPALAMTIIITDITELFHSGEYLQRDEKSL